MMISKKIGTLMLSLLLTGCVSDTVNSFRAAVITPDVPKIKNTYPINKYKDMNFTDFVKNIIPAKFNFSLGTTYKVDCESVTKFKGVKLNSPSSLCWIKGRPYTPIQNTINDELNNLNYQIAKELDKYCLAKGGFVKKGSLRDYNKINKITERKGVWNICFIKGKPYFAYNLNSSARDLGLTILSPKYFYYMKLSFTEKQKLLKQYLLKHGAKLIKKNLLDVSHIIVNNFYLDDRSLQKIVQNFFPPEVYKDSLLYPYEGDLLQRNGIDPTILNSKIMNNIEDILFGPSFKGGYIYFYYTFDYTPILLFSQRMDKNHVMWPDKILLISDEKIIKLKNYLNKLRDEYERKRLIQKQKEEMQEEITY